MATIGENHGSVAACGGCQCLAAQPAIKEGVSANCGNLLLDILRYLSSYLIVE